MKGLDLIPDSFLVTSIGFFSSFLCALMERGPVFSPGLRLIWVTTRHRRESLVAYFVWHQVAIWGLAFHVSSDILQCSYLYPGRNQIHPCLSWPGDLPMMPAFSRKHRKCFMMLQTLRRIALTESRSPKLRLRASSGMTPVQMRWKENKTLTTILTTLQLSNLIAASFPGRMLSYRVQYLIRLGHLIW